MPEEQLPSRCFPSFFCFGKISDRPPLRPKARISREGRVELLSFQVSHVVHQPWRWVQLGTVGVGWVEWVGLGGKVVDTKKVQFLAKKRGM